MPARGIETGMTVAVGLHKKRPSRTTERTTCCLLFGFSRGVQSFSVTLEKVGAVLPTGLEFHTGKLPASAEQDTGCPLCQCSVWAYSKAVLLNLIQNSWSSKGQGIGQQHCKYHRALSSLGSHS